MNKIFHKICFFTLFLLFYLYNDVHVLRGVVLMVEQRSPKPTVVSSSLTAPAIQNQSMFSIVLCYPEKHYYLFDFVYDCFTVSLFLNTI